MSENTRISPRLGCTVVELLVKLTGFPDDYQVMIGHQPEGEDGPIVYSPLSLRQVYVYHNDRTVNLDLAAEA